MKCTSQTFRHPLPQPPKTNVCCQTFLEASFITFLWRMWSKIREIKLHCSAFCFQQLNRCGLSYFVARSKKVWSVVSLELLPLLEKCWFFSIQVTFGMNQSHCRSLPAEWKLRWDLSKKTICMGKNTRKSKSETSLFQSRFSLKEFELV